MAGFLNNKSRVMDVILTELGRDQMNRGEFQAVYATFSDKGADYQEAEEGVAKDISNHQYFEAYSSPCDEIIPEIDNEGNFTLTKRVSPNLEVNNGVLNELTATGWQEVDAFENLTDFLKLTTSRFGELQTLRTVTEVPDFHTSKSTINMVPSATIDLPRSVGGLNPIIVDQRFAGSINNKFLPPTVYNDGENQVLSAYNKYTKDYTLDTVLEEITAKSWSSDSIRIGSTDEDFEEYNILGQFFMKKDQSLIKLLAIDAGEFFDKDNEPVANIYHFGLIYKDELGISKFSRAFSLVFHNLGE